MAVETDPARLLRQFGTMLLIRRFEETVWQLFDDGAFRGHYHLYTGQEATGVPVIAALGKTDTVFSTHRNHGHLLALGSDPAAALGEILGRAGGVGGGRLGTFHLADPLVSMPHTSALVGGCVPLAAGSAFGAKLRKTGGISVGFFGDGAFEEGVVFETLNLARLWKLPVLFVCENNTPGARTKAEGGNNTSYLPDGRVASVPESLGIPTYVLDGGDLEAMDAVALEAVSKVRSSGAPVFIEALTVRWPGNQTQYPQMVTGRTDLAMAWEAGRIGNEHTAWFERDDPVLRAARLLIEMKATDAAALTALDADICARLDEAREAALAMPLPDPATAMDHVMAGGAR
jgi:TPP-dependent pyruvate/acetoin dehydrogenase alpha subunit